MLLNVWKSRHSSINARRDCRLVRPVRISLKTVYGWEEGCIYDGVWVCGLNWTLGLHGDGLKVGGGTGVTGRYVQLVVVHILGIWDAFDETCRLDLRDLSLFHLFLDAYTRSYIH